MSQTPINRKQVAQLIKKTTKKVIAESGINPSTRSGNQELEYVVKRLASQPFSSLEVAEAVGETLGQKIVALSQQMGKQNLDRAVIWKLVAQKDLPAIEEDTSASTPKATAQAAKPSTTTAPTKAIEESIVEESVTVREPAVSEDPLEVSEAPITSSVASAVTPVDQAADAETVAVITKDITNDIPEIENEEEVESPVAETEAADRTADLDIADAEAIEPITGLEDKLEVEEIEEELENDEIEPITELEDDELEDEIEEHESEEDESVAELEDESEDELEVEADATELEAALESVAEPEAEMEANELEPNKIAEIEAEMEAELTMEPEPAVMEPVIGEDVLETDEEAEPKLTSSRDR